MSNLKESNTCPPDGYRALSTTELRELLQNDDKMDQIIRLNEKVGTGTPSSSSAPLQAKCCEEFALHVKSLLVSLCRFLSLLFPLLLLKKEHFWGVFSYFNHVFYVQIRSYMAHRLSAWRVVGFPILFSP